MARFRVGDLVHSKAGGPQLVVDRIIDGSQLICTWWDGTNRRSEPFETETIEPWADYQARLDAESAEAQRLNDSYDPLGTYRS